jgi:hypothetical protein
MPLKPGYSHETFERNYAQLKKEGYLHPQALAIAFDEARKSFFATHPDGALPLWLTPKGGHRMKPRAKPPCKECSQGEYVEASQPGYLPRKKNPVPPSRKVQLRDAGQLYSDFTGHEAEVIDELDKPEYPDVLLCVGDIDFIGYTTVRDGVTEKYIHKFKKNCRPLFTVSPDGTQIFLLGGSYDFTERGIVDKT